MEFLLEILRLQARQIHLVKWIAERRAVTYRSQMLEVVRQVHGGIRHPSDILNGLPGGNKQDLDNLSLWEKEYHENEEKIKELMDKVPVQASV